MIFEILPKVGHIEGYFRDLGIWDSPYTCDSSARVTESDTPI